jgi:hypothetical protein
MRCSGKKLIQTSYRNKQSKIYYKGNNKTTTNTSLLLNQ